MDNTPELQAVERKSDYQEHLPEMIDQAEAISEWKAENTF